LFLFLSAGSGRFFLLGGFGLVVGDVLLGRVGLVQLLFGACLHGLPLLYYLGDKLGLPHSRKLVLVFVVFLTRKLSVQLGQVFLLELTLHRYF